MSISSPCDQLLQSMQILDPLVQFFTRATGQSTVPLTTLLGALGLQNGIDLASNPPISDIPELVERGVLHMVFKATPGSIFSVEPSSVFVGFPPPPDNDDDNQSQHKKRPAAGLHPSTKTAAKRRIAALKKSLKLNPHQPNPSLSANNKDDHDHSTIKPLTKEWEGDSKKPREEAKPRSTAVTPDHFAFDGGAPSSSLEVKAFKELSALMKTKESWILPDQAKYAGSREARKLKIKNLSSEVSQLIPKSLSEALSLSLADQTNDQQSQAKRKLFSHQADAIEAACRGHHTIVCTSTGSGKSLCFLLPVLSAAMGSQLPLGKNSKSSTSILMFPTKALAQDQLSKINALLQDNPELRQHIRAATLDGDTPQSDRKSIAEECNLILTNPDTLHAAILPNWKYAFESMLASIRFVVIDEAHLYQGTFGAHVSLILTRFVRLCRIAAGKARSSSSSWIRPTFFACSATMPHPEEHFRLLCPIPSTSHVKVITPEDDGSPW